MQSKEGPQSARKLPPAQTERTHPLSRVSLVCLGCSERAVSVRAKSAPANVRIGDLRRAATANAPQQQTDAASAKARNPRSGKSATETLATSAANGRFSALRRLVLCAANDGSEPNPAIAHSCCVRSRRGKCCCDTEFYAASRQELRSFKLLSVPLGTLSMLSACRVPL